MRMHTHASSAWHVRACAHQHGHPPLMSEHGDEGGARAADERAVEEHGGAAEEHLAHLRHDVGDRVQVDVVAGDPRCEEALDHVPALEARPGVGHDDPVLDALPVRGEKDLLDDERARVDEEHVAGRDALRGVAEDGEVGQLDALVQVGVHLGAEHLLDLVLGQVRRGMAHLELEPLRHAGQARRGSGGSGGEAGGRGRGGRH